MSRFFLAWLLVTLGLALLSVSVALVPDNALADDGDPVSCGTCTYQWNSMTRMWTMTLNCGHINCTCPNPPGLPDGTTNGETRPVNCETYTGLDSCIGCNPVCATGNPPVPGPCVTGYPYVPPCWSYCSCRPGLYGALSCYGPY